MYRVFANVPLKIDECIAFLSAGKGKGAQNAWFLTVEKINFFLPDATERTGNKYS